MFKAKYDNKADNRIFLIFNRGRINFNLGHVA